MDAIDTGDVVDNNNIISLNSDVRENSFNDETRRKVDQFINDEIRDDLLVDVEIYGFAFLPHNYFFLSEADRMRLNRLRIKIDQIKRLIENRRHRNIIQDTETKCPICLSNIRTVNVPICSLECGHLYCEPCLERAHDETNLQVCLYCSQKIQYEKKRRTYV